MPLIVEAYAGRVEMLNAIFGGSDKTKAQPCPSGGKVKKPTLAVTGGSRELAAGFRALAAMQKGRGVDGG